MFEGLQKMKKFIILLIINLVLSWTNSASAFCLNIISVGFPTISQDNIIQKMQACFGQNGCIKLKFKVLDDFFVNINNPTDRINLDKSFLVFNSQKISTEKDKYINLSNFNSLKTIPFDIELENIDNHSAGTYSAFFEVLLTDNKDKILEEKVFCFHINNPLKVSIKNGENVSLAENFELKTNASDNLVDYVLSAKIKTDCGLEDAFFNLDGIDYVMLGNTKNLPNKNSIEDAKNNLNVSYPNILVYKIFTTNFIQKNHI